MFNRIYINYSAYLIYFSIFFIFTYNKEGNLCTLFSSSVVSEIQYVVRCIQNFPRTRGVQR